MVDYLKKVLIEQYEAAIAMLNECVHACPSEHWDGKIARYTFWNVAYHTLCFLDLYLSPNEGSFQFRDLHPQGWSEFNEEYPSRRFEQPEIARYVAICRQKAVESIATETRESLEGPSGFHRLPFSRGELHVYNIRHVQHHTGQLSAYLRRIDEALQDPQAMRWARTGWPEKQP